MTPPRLMSGVRPTSALHLGNYLGVIRHWPLLQQTNECCFLIADLHGLATSRDSDIMRRQRLEVAATCVSAGLDQRSSLFFQSAMPQHPAMAWCLGSVATKGELERMSQWQLVAGGNAPAAAANALDYPLLMAADMLLYDLDSVFVGSDQTQHAELAVALGQRLNDLFGSDVLLPAVVASDITVMDLMTPHLKMSKSSERTDGTIFVLDSPDVIMDKFRNSLVDGERGIYASRERPGLTNLINIHMAISGEDFKVVQDTHARTLPSDFAESVAELVVSELAPIRERTIDMLSNPDTVREIVEVGQERAAVVARRTFERVRESMGIGPI